MVTTGSVYTVPIIEKRKKQRYEVVAIMPMSLFKQKPEADGSIFNLMFPFNGTISQVKIYVGVLANPIVAKCSVMHNDVTEVREFGLHKGSNDLIVTTTVVAGDRCVISVAPDAVMEDLWLSLVLNFTSNPTEVE